MVMHLSAHLTKCLLIFSVEIRQDEFRNLCVLLCANVASRSTFVQLRTPFTHPALLSPNLYGCDKAALVFGDRSFLLRLRLTKATPSPYKRSH